MNDTIETIDVHAHYGTHERNASDFLRENAARLLGLAVKAGTG
jgi:hypothetical protein